jgi:hypothetical protein
VAIKPFFVCEQICPEKVNTQNGQKVQFLSGKKSSRRRGKIGLTSGFGSIINHKFTSLEAPPVKKLLNLFLFRISIPQSPSGIRTSDVHGAHRQRIWSIHWFIVKVLGFTFKTIIIV